MFLHYNRNYSVNLILYQYQKNIISFYHLNDTCFIYLITIGRLKLKLLIFNKLLLLSIAVIYNIYILIYSP